ncbi:MAG: DUF4440 domain-containing protein [Hyphomonadaceae bacterium]
MKRSVYRYTFGAMIVALAVACSPAPTENLPAAPSADAAKATLEAALQADRDFAAAVGKDGPKAAFLAWFHPTDSQFVQPGAYLKGAEAIAAPFAQSPPNFSIGWTPDSGVASASGDFATTTGRYAVKIGDQTVEQGRYMTSWRKDETGAWKVVMDATIADPPASTAPSAPDPNGRPG